jgi:PEP-CTERM motif
MPIAASYASIVFPQTCELGGIVKRRLISVAAIVALCFVYAGTAKADNLHLCDVNAVCNSGSIIQLFSPTTTVFANGTSYANSTLFLAVLTPVADNSGNFNTRTTFWGALSVNTSKNYPVLANAILQEQGTGIVPLSFNVTAISQGAWNGSATITLPAGQPIGTIYMGYVLDAQGNLLGVTPWTSSMVNVPEPSSLVLLGAGLLALGLASRKLMAA